MNLFDFLKKKQRKRLPFKKTDDYHFYFKHRFILMKFPRFSYLNELSNEFDVIRANIVIRGYLNKQLFENEIESLNKYLNIDSNIEQGKIINLLKERLVDAPYFLEDKNKIFIPFFSRSLNHVYTREPEKLLKEPYNGLKTNFVESVIDPFETYGANLYDSLFTRLLKVDTDGKAVAYFYYDTNTIYIINSQGRLDAKIVLFDKYIKHPNYNHMLERIYPVTRAYFSYKRSEMINALYDNGFISNKLLSLINHNKGGYKR